MAKSKGKKERPYISAEERQAARAKKSSKQKKHTKRDSAVNNVGEAAIAEKPKRKRKKRPSRFSRMTKQQKIVFLAVIIVAALVIFSYARSIVSLSIENRKLRAQQEQLIEERDRLKSTLKNVDSSDYIEEQARKQLRLMNPDEILFIFGEKGTDNAKE